MGLQLTTAKSIIRRHKHADSWFAACYGMNLYRGCSHDCAYCDGRAEQYRVEGDFARDIQVKTNAPAIVARELDPKRKRKPLRRGYVLLGGGVNDSHQALEKEHRLARQVLEVLTRHPFPVHVLTKSPLIARDLDLLQQIERLIGEMLDTGGCKYYESMLRHERD
ncbi:MAG: hypothetical protein HN348_28565 [Proteobacteria bacterium]|jgi:DNA repair photolyase|nr:hypothetical protein [Pseudomonadota bacterium]